MLCIKCGGTGQYLGNGFIMTDCNMCNGYSEEIEAPPLVNIDRRTKSYQKAIKEIMDLNPKITRNDAVKMFDEAYAKG